MNKIIKTGILCLNCLVYGLIGRGQTLPWSQQMAATAMRLWKDSLVTDLTRPAQWNYDQGVVLKGMEAVWKATADGDYFRYIQHQIDFFVQKNGTIRTYHPEDDKLDDINNGKLLLMLYEVTNEKKYWTAATDLWQQLQQQPRTPQGGFWHKKIYPQQMWLDGLYMAEPFYAQYASIIHDNAAFKDIAHQFILIAQHTRDPKTGLLYHGWDASHKEKWAGPNGHSSNFWGRADGWYAMALVDALDYFPKNNMYRDSLINIFDQLAVAIKRFQDPASGCWFQVLDKGNEKGNYLEASASCMFVYALAKGVRKGYLSASYLAVAKKGFLGILSHFIQQDNGQINLTGTCRVAGLGGHPYRDGSYDYYVSQRPATNDPKGIGTFILATNEMEIAQLQPMGKGTTVTLDYYFNHEMKKDITGRPEQYHYTWEDEANSGFSFFHHIFSYRGATTTSLKEAPTENNLSHSNIYIIVDPDTKAETAHPNYIEPKDIHAITNWVKQGGELVLMANDSGNCEFTHLNELAAKFGIHYNEDSRNHVEDHHFEQGALTTPADEIFKTAKKIYIKELSSISVQAPAKAELIHDGYIIFAISHLGKGIVFAVGDPWLYNEYTDGRKLPADYQNYQAGCDLADWLIKQSSIGTILH